MPTVEQALACVRVCQMLSNSYRAIYVFRYDTNRKIVYIQAGTEVQTDESKKLPGAQIPIPAASGRGITEFALRDALPLCSCT